MRNVFDQYTQPENRLTHALFSALHQQRTLLRSFIRDICKVPSPPPADDLTISVQQYPGGREYTETEIFERNIPDAWLFDENGWSLLFEAKITARLTQRQLDGHRRTAARHGLEPCDCFAIIGEDTSVTVPGWKLLRWVDIYRWLRAQENSAKDRGPSWARLSADYFEVLEARLLSEGKLGSAQITEFAGFFRTSADYNYTIAKNRIKNAMRALRRDRRLIEQLGMDPEAAGRGAITGKDADAVWDFLRLADAGGTNSFTSFPHLTLGVGRLAAEAMVTFPNALKSTSRRNLLAGGRDAFRRQCEEVLTAMGDVLAAQPAARPIMRAVQRRYPSQRAAPILDAALEFDLRTAFPLKGSGPKPQHQWFDALHHAVASKRSNLQFQIGVSFAYPKCPTMQSDAALDMVARSWLACRSMLDGVLSRK
jgi:hypothetical protein